MVMPALRAFPAEPVGFTNFLMNKEEFLCLR